MYITDFSYTLQHPVGFANNGSKDEITTIILSSPSANQLQASRKLKQHVMRGLMDISNRNKGNSETLDDTQADDEDVSIDAKAYIAMLYSSSLDIEEYFNAFKDLLRKGVAKINDTDVKLITDLYDELSPEDAENILGEYIANFLIPSSMLKA